MGKIPEKGFFFGHGHASGDPNDRAFMRAASQLANFSHHFPFSKIADGTGVKNKQIGVFSSSILVSPRF